MFKSLSLKKESKEQREAKDAAKGGNDAKADAKAQGGARLGGRVGSFRKSRKGGATVTALEAAGAAKVTAPTPPAARDDGAGEKVQPKAAQGSVGTLQPLQPLPLGTGEARPRPTRSISMTSGTGALPVPVGWPLGDATMGVSVSVTNSASGAAADADALAGAESVADTVSIAETEGEEAALQPTGATPESDNRTGPPAILPAPASSSAAPTPGATPSRPQPSPVLSVPGSQASFAGLDVAERTQPGSQAPLAGLEALAALEREIAAKDRELMESKRRHEDSEGALRALEAQWRAEAEAARAQLAAATRAREELELQLAARDQERASLAEAPPSAGQPGKRSKAEPSASTFGGNESKLQVQAPPSVEVPGAAEEEGAGAGPEGGVLEGEYEGVSSPDSAAVLELIAASRSESSPQGKQLVGLRLENVVLKERVADLERDRAALASRLEELQKGQGKGLGTGVGPEGPLEKGATGEDTVNLAEKLAAAEARLAELERENASLVDEVARLNANGAVPGSRGLKAAPFFDLFCAS